MDRQAINRALAKALAYREAGKRTEAEQWARELVRQLDTVLGNDRWHPAQ